MSIVEVPSLAYLSATIVASEPCRAVDKRGDALLRAKSALHLVFSLVSLRLSYAFAIALSEL